MTKRRIVKNHCTGCTLSQQRNTPSFRTSLPHYTSRYANSLHPLTTHIMTALSVLVISDTICPWCVLQLHHQGVR